MTKATPSRSRAAAAASTPRARTPEESFHAQRRGATPAPPAPVTSKPRAFERVNLPEPGRGPARPANSAAHRERNAKQRRFQAELERAPLAQGLRLRLDYADDGVSRIHLPGVSQNTEPGPLEGGVVGTLSVVAGHFAAASIAPAVGIRLVESKVNILGVVQGDLLAIGEVVRKGRTLVACRVEIVEDNDRVVAVGLLTYLLQQT